MTTVTQSWETTVRRMFFEAECRGERSDKEEFAMTLVMAALRASRNHPEWAQAKLLALPDSKAVDRLAALLVKGSPVERMAI